MDKDVFRSVVGYDEAEAFGGVKPVIGDGWQERMVREVSWLERKIKSKNIKPRETLIIDHMMHGATVNNSTRTNRNRQQTYHLTVPFFTSLMLRAVEERAN